MRVEVYLGDGVPSFRTVGLPDASVREARERVRAALRTNGFEYPGGRITLSLAPAEIPKQGAGFDLAVAIGLLAAGDQVLKKASLSLRLTEASFSNLRITWGKGSRSTCHG